MNPMTCLLSVGAAMAVLAGTAMAQEVVFDANFEVESGERPPAGWTMWGPQKDKDPANYTRVTAKPHSGAACFRVHHPADTNGYIVSTPNAPLEPRESMRYAASFWARADRPGRAQFGFTAYRTIAPYIDAPSPGWLTFGVGTDWQRFELEVTEGLDFWAHDSRLILLSFKATTDLAAEATLYVDDVAVTAEPVDASERLVDEATLTPQPLEHRLEPGETLDVVVDVSRPVRPATKLAGGISFHRLGGWTGQPYDQAGEYTLHPKLEEAMRELRLPMTRFYAVGEEPFGLEGALDRAAEFCRRIGVPLDAVPLELESVHAGTSLPPEAWARAVRYAQSKGYGFRYWEVGNEVYAALWGNDTAFATPDDYVRHFVEVSKAVKGVDADAQVGLSMTRGNVRWGSYVMKHTAGHYDFVVSHHYAGFGAHDHAFEDVALALNYQALEGVLQLNALIEAYNPGREVYQYDTEWGMHSLGPDGEKADYIDRNANIFGTVHRGVRLIYYAREGMLRGASSWQMLNRVGAQGFGILAQEVPDQRFMLYWLYYYFNRHVGESVLGMTGTAPYYESAARQYADAPAGPATPLLATLSEDGRQVYLVMANGLWDTAVPFRVSLAGFQGRAVEAVVLSHDDPDGKPLLSRKEDGVRSLSVTLSGEELTGELPPHSMVFVSVRDAAAMP